MNSPREESRLAPERPAPARPAPPVERPEPPVERPEEPVERPEEPDRSGRDAPVRAGRRSVPPGPTPRELAARESGAPAPRRSGRPSRLPLIVSTSSLLSEPARAAPTERPPSGPPVLIVPVVRPTGGGWGFRPGLGGVDVREGPPRGGGPSRLKSVRRRPTLPRGPPRSTIGAERLSFRVRNGTGRFPLAMATETLWS